MGELVVSWKANEVVERKKNEYVVVYESGLKRNRGVGGGILKRILPLRPNGECHWPKMRNFGFLMLMANVISLMANANGVKCAEIYFLVVLKICRCS